MTLPPPPILPTLLLHGVGSKRELRHQAPLYKLQSRDQGELVTKDRCLGHSAYKQVRPVETPKGCSARSLIMHAGPIPSSLEPNSRHVCRLETAANPSNKPTGFGFPCINRLFFLPLQRLFSSAFDFAGHTKCFQY